MSWSLMGVKKLYKHSVVEKNLNWQRDLMDLSLQDRRTDLKLREPRNKIW